MGCLLLVLAADVLSGPLGSLCLNSAMYFSVLPDLYLFFKLLWPLSVLLTGRTCSWEMEVS